MKSLFVGNKSESNQGEEGRYSNVELIEHHAPPHWPFDKLIEALVDWQIRRGDRILAKRLKRKKIARPSGSKIMFETTGNKGRRK